MIRANSEFIQLHAQRLIVSSFVIISVVACSGPPEETIEQYAKNPIGCDSQSAQWYAERVATPSGQAELKKRAKTFEMRADYHSAQIDFVSISQTERSEHVRKTISCLREFQWSVETLAKAGISAK